MSGNCTNFAAAMRKLAVFFMMLLGSLSAAAQETPNAKQARRIFDTAYERVFGAEGSKMSYDLTIASLYKTKGTLWMKGKKKRFSDERVDSWNNGKTVYIANRKKHMVEIHDADSEKKDKYSSKFKFSLDDFDYSIANDPQGLLITLKQKKKAKGTIKEVKALVAQRTYAPIRLRIKVAFIWTTIKISDFHSGNVSDQMFEFPQEKYVSGWKYVDKR